MTGFLMAHAAPNATSLTGVYSGQYRCPQGQGLQGVQFVLEGDSIGNVNGVMEFSPVSSNPTTESGSYRVSGTLGQNGILNLKPIEWVKPPISYGMLGFQFKVGDNKWSGKVTDPGCSTAAVTRVKTVLPPLSLVNSAFVRPLRYTATPGEMGEFLYADETGTQLIDRATGGDSYRVSKARGPGFEWVGWLKAEPEMAFTFAPGTKIAGVAISFLREDPMNVNLPITLTIGDQTFTLKGDEMSNNHRGYLVFPIKFTGELLNIKMADSNPEKFIFVDEVVFLRR